MAKPNGDEPKSKRARESQLRQRGHVACRRLTHCGSTCHSPLLGTGAADRTQNAHRAENERRVALARELSVNAVNNLNTDPERSILLALQAVSISSAGGKTVLREAEEALHRAVQASRVQLTIRGHADYVYGIAFSPDGTRPGYRQS